MAAKTNANIYNTLPVLYNINSSTVILPQQQHYIYIFIAILIYIYFHNMNPYKCKMKTI